MVTGVGSISGEESTLETKGSGGDSDPKKCSLCDYEPETIEMGLLHMVSAHGAKLDNIQTMEQSEIKAEPEAEVKQEIEPETQQQPDPLLLAQLIELLTKQQQQLAAATVKESPKPAKKRAGGEYPCGFCEKVFSCYSHMKKHEIVHSDERPFKCDFCEKLFRRKYDCSRHMKVVHIQRFMKRKLEPTVEGRGIFSTFLSCSFCYA